MVDNYEWCGSSTYQASGWETIVNDFEDLGVAAYMSEYGFVLSFSQGQYTLTPLPWQLHHEPATIMARGGVALLAADDGRV